MNAGFQKHGDGLKATFALVCNNSVGEILLCDADGKYLLTSDGEYLTVKKIKPWRIIH